MTIKSVIFTIWLVTINAQFEEKCNLRQFHGAEGRCTPIRQCPYAIVQLQRSIKPQLCGFSQFDPIVCCPLKETYEPTQTYSSSPVRAFGALSDKKCKEYIEKPLDREAGFHTAVVGGTAASAKEFPHMAILGYGNANAIQWLCGGSLVSENFILTAAHCLSSPDVGEVKYVRLGDINIRSNEENADPQDFQVIGIFRHPDYSPPSKYNDIALLRLNASIEFSEYVRPSCLDTKGGNYPQKLLATGWGKTQFTGETSDKLLKVDLSVFPWKNCQKIYETESKRILPNGIVDKFQLCAGGVDEAKDTCQGDSGGPLQYQIPANKKRHVVVGVTSFGKGCGLQNIPGVYTRVFQYIPWIERIVWSN